MFLITAGKGFQITFENGWTVSVQFGSGNYCENRWTRKDLFDLYDPLSHDVSSKDAEVTRWYGEKDDMDEPTGYMSPDDVAKYIAKTAKLEAINDTRA